MSLDAAFSIARSGLAATQRALAQASQNIANAGTEGYTRKTVSNVSADYAGQPLGVRSAEARRCCSASNRVALSSGTPFRWHSLQM